MINNKISILISTKNRCDELLLTLNNSKHLFNNDVTCVVFDDGSVDNTFKKVKMHFPQVKVFRNEISKGYIYCRNKMLNETVSDIAISLDDDAHFLSTNPIEIIKNHFSENPNCGLIAARIYWSKSEIENYNCTDISQQVKSYVGCGHVRMKAWRSIPNCR